MWLNNLTVYAVEFAYPDTWADQLAAHPITDPPTGQKRAIGFRPASADGAYVDRIEDHYALLCAVAERHLPKDVVDREVQRRNAGKEVEDAKEAWNEVQAALLNTSHVHEKTIGAVYDAVWKRLFVFGSRSQAEQVVLAGLRKALGSFTAVPISPKEALTPKLTAWVRDGKAPTPFLLGRMCELEADAEKGAKTVIRNQALSNPTIQQQIADGDTVSTLALNWNGKLEFRLNRLGEIKNVAPPDCKMKPQYIFNMWPDVMDQLPQFFEAVMTLLGGERELGDAVEVEERQRKVAQDAASDSRASSADAPSSEQPSGPPVRIAIVAHGGDGDIEVVRSGLDSLAAKRRISEIVLPDIGNSLMRSIYTWIRDRQLPLRLVPIHTGTEEDRMHKVFSFKPAGIVSFGTSAEVREYEATARNRNIGVMRLGTS